MNHTNKQLAKSYKTLSVLISVFFVALWLIRIAFSAASSLTSAMRDTQIARRRHYGSDPLQMRHFSGFSRASRQTKLPIQRI